VNIDQLIEKIYIHPKSENWYKDLVINLVKQLGFDFTIEKSDLESDTDLVFYPYFKLARNNYFPFII
jgi:hypothetical protein